MELNAPASEMCRTHTFTPAFSHTRTALTTKRSSQSSQHQRGVQWSSSVLSLSSRSRLLRLRLLYHSQVACTCPSLALAQDLAKRGTS